MKKFFLKALMLRSSLLLSVLFTCPNITIAQSNYWTIFGGDPYLTLLFQMLARRIWNAE